MCSIVVFAKADNIHPDPKLQWQKFGRGDVIDMSEDDNCFWGNDVQGPNALGWWRVIVLPGVPTAKVRGLLSPEILGRQALDSAPRKLRANKLDLDALEAAAVTSMGKALAKTDVVHATEPMVLGRMSLKPATAATGLDVLAVLPVAPVV